MAATAADFRAALEAARSALDHGGEISGANLTLIIRVLEYGANTLDTTGILPPVVVDPLRDG